MNNSRTQVDRIKKMYPTGTRIELISTMDDMQGVEGGTQGTVTGVDDIGTIHMKWDNGRGLGLIVKDMKIMMRLLYQIIFLKRQVFQLMQNFVLPQKKTVVK